MYGTTQIPRYQAGPTILIHKTGTENAQLISHHFAPIFAPEDPAPASEAEGTEANCKRKCHNNKLLPSQKSRLFSIKGDKKVS